MPRAHHLNAGPAEIRRIIVVVSLTGLGPQGVIRWSLGNAGCGGFSWGLAGGFICASSWSFTVTAAQVGQDSAVFRW